jgi:hypothetical protein
MEKYYYDEMLQNLVAYESKIKSSDIFLFGHCEATLALADVLLERGIVPVAILDNSAEKQGKDYKGIPVLSPESILKADGKKAMVLIVTRFYEAMNAQLRSLGFKGEIVKLADYNTFAEYSLSEETINRKQQRLEHGKELLNGLKTKYKGTFLVFCPHNALGDICFAMSFLPAFLATRGFDRYAVFTPSKSCADVAMIYGAENVEAMEPKELEATIQAVIYTQDEACFIAHHDRPYVVNLHKALYKKLITLETVYKCGVYGLPKETKPIEPMCFTEYDKLDQIPEGKTVILAPYAKSVAPIDERIWTDIVKDYGSRGYKVYTNVVGNEEPLPGTEGLSAKISEMKSILERAGTFIGIRSGLCDVVRTAKCKKIALYPDYNYCDTKWKAIDMYSIDGFENIAVCEGYKWKR